MNDTMSGPADIVLTYGSSLIRLAMLELWCAAQRSRAAAAKLAAAAVMVVANLYTAVGVFGTVALR